MIYEERARTNEIIEDIRNIFFEEMHSYVLVSEEGVEALRNVEGMHHSRRNLDTVGRYNEKNILALEKFTKDQHHKGITDVIGLVKTCKNMYLIIYFFSDYVEMEFVDENNKKHSSIRTTQDEPKRVIYLKWLISKIVPKSELDNLVRF